MIDTASPPKLTQLGMLLRSVYSSISMLLHSLQGRPVLGGGFMSLASLLWATLTQQPSSSALTPFAYHLAQVALLTDLFTPYYLAP